ncbi:MAG: hypothetical protein N2Z22_02470 [Turneriella sp.]|nr:hypothetical protein [Turneriella sp.]
MLLRPKRLLFLSLPWLLVPALAQSHKFSISIQLPEDAESAEIEFWDIDPARASPEEQRQARSKAVRTQEKIYREEIPAEFRFFRVRSIHKTGVPGPFSKTFAIVDFVQKAPQQTVIPPQPQAPQLVFVRQGRTDYLVGKKIELQQEPGTTTRYRIGDGEFQEYNSPLIFDKPGTYRLEIVIEDKNKNVVSQKQYIFRVELTPPETRALIDHPINSRSGVKFGKESALVLVAKDDESGVAQTLFRIVPLGQDAEKVPFQNYTHRRSWHDTCKSAAVHLLQYYSVDIAGNQEPTKSQVLFCEEE